MLVHSDLQGMNICTRGDRNNSLAQGFIGSVVLVGSRSYCVCAHGAVLVGHRGRRALVKEGPPLVLPIGVLSVCVWHWLLVFHRWSRASLVPVTHRSTSRLATSPSLPMMLWVSEVPSAVDTLQGTTSQ
jgi:hypothetical protein